jgi:hypothetical protein
MPDSKPAVKYPWKPIEPLGARSRVSNGTLVGLDALRKEWERHLTSLTEDELSAVRRRSLRRLSVETGIIERIYELDWGLTLTLVAEGFAREVVERAGGKVDDRTLATLKAQMESLEMVLDFVRSNRSLSPSFIKELHQAITRTQTTYTATDTLGRVFDRDLPHGEWKKEPNHVLRKDNTLLEYCPPEHVPSEIDRLVALFEDLAKDTVHPIIQAAWLHHRFVQIHPFSDGNGRVARALTLLVLEKHRYAPLVVDRFHRADYIDALDSANDGDLQMLVRLFTKLESSALSSELDRPAQMPERGFALDVAHTLASQLAEARKRRQSDVVNRLKVRAQVIADLMRRWFDTKAHELQTTFRSKGLFDVKVFADTEMPPDSGIHDWFRKQTIDSARTAGHFADFSFFSGWSRLRIRVEGSQLLFIASLHGAGREQGVMAVTTFGILVPPQEASGEETEPRHTEWFQTTKDAFRFVHTEQPDDIAQRGHELEELLDEGLVEALAKLLSNV